MPHIRALFVDNLTVEMMLADNAREIREALHLQFPKYEMDAIALIPESIPSKRMRRAFNLLPLEFVIDVGKQTEPIDESHSDALREKLLELCPELSDINFGIWIREMPSNGFTEHKRKA